MVLPFPSVSYILFFHAPLCALQAPLTRKELYGGPEAGSMGLGLSAAGWWWALLTLSRCLPAYRPEA